MAELLIARFEVGRRLAGLAVVLSLFVACEGDLPGGPSGTPTPTPLTVSSVAPNTATSGALVTISGSGFRAGATVTFGGVKAEVFSVLNSSITAKTPELAPGRVDIVVTNTDGERATLAGGFTLAAPAPFAVADYFPKRGYGAMLFGLAGPGLIAGTTVKFGGVPATEVHPGAPFGIFNGLLPPHDPGPVDITVTHPDGRTVTIPNGLTYVPPPILTAFPVTVTVGGSVTVTYVTEVNSSIDYISLYPVGGQEWEFKATQHVTGNSGTMTFIMPISLSPGLYEFRYLPTEGQWGAIAARSNVVTVTSALPAHAYDIGARAARPKSH